MSEGEEGASGKRPAESETEASGQQQPFGESAQSGDERSQESTEHSFEGWTPGKLQALSFLSLCDDCGCWSCALGSPNAR